MSNRDRLIEELSATRRFFHRTTDCFEEADSGFAPDPAIYTVANQVAHAAQTVDWAIEGGFGKGWDMDFETHDKQCRAVTSLAEARRQLDAAFENANRVIRDASQEQLDEPMSDDSIMPGAPRSAVVGAIVDHSAHHRGALAVYARLIGKTPAVPYV